MKLQITLVLVSALLVLAGCRSYYYQQPALLYPPWRVVRQCGLFGCIDHTASSVSGSIISGVNGTLLGIGDGIAGLTNGTIAIGAGIIQGTGSAIGGLASQGGNAIGGTAAAVGQVIGGSAPRALCTDGLYYYYC